MAVTKVQRYGRGMLVIHDDGSRDYAVATGGGLWIVSGNGSGGGGEEWRWPFQYSTSVLPLHDAQYGTRLDGSFHNGLDFGAGTDGLDVTAAADGTVVQSVAGHASLGTYVDLEHRDGTRTRYAHMVAGSVVVAVGDPIAIGAKIGVVGMTGVAGGPHLHWETWTGSAASSRVNPRTFMADRGYPET